MSEVPKPAAMRVKLKYASIDAFLVKYGPDLARGRVFIPTRSPRPVGSLLRFELMLSHEGEDRSILRGEGTVQQVRGPDAQGRGAGVGLKLTRVFGDGQALLDRANTARTIARESAVREITGEVELTNPRDIDSGEYPAAPRQEPLDIRADLPPEAAPDVSIAPTPATPPPSAEMPDMAEPLRSTVPPSSVDEHVDVDALASEWQISAERVDEILRRRRPRDPASAQELESLLSAPPPPALSPAEATARLAQLLDRRRRPR